MANVWGIAQNALIATKYGTVAAGDVTLTSSTEVTFITTGTIVMPQAGDYYPLITGVLVDYLGATAPSALVIAFKIGAGSDVVTYTVDPGQLVNNAKIVVPFMLVGTTSGSAWFPTGSTINITANGTGQASTAKNVGSYAFVQMIQGPNI